MQTLVCQPHMFYTSCTGSEGVYPDANMHLVKAIALLYVRTCMLSEVELSMQNSYMAFSQGRCSVVIYAHASCLKVEVVQPGCKGPMATFMSGMLPKSKKPIGTLWIPCCCHTAKQQSYLTGLSCQCPRSSAVR